MKNKLSANRQISQSVAALFKAKYESEQEYVLASEITYVVDGQLYEYEPSNGFLKSQTYFNRCVNQYIRMSHLRQDTNSAFGKPFKNAHGKSRVIYLGPY